MSVATMIPNVEVSITALIITGLLTRLYQQWREKKNITKFTMPNLPFAVEMAAEPIRDARFILVTGGNGFLGRHVVDMLVNTKKLNVIVLDVSIPEKSKRSVHVTYVQGSILIKDHIEKTLNLPTKLQGDHVHSVLHLASLVPYLGVPYQAIWEVNVTGTEKVLECAVRHGVKSLVYTSSATAVLDAGKKESLNLTEDCPWPARHLDQYTYTKKCAEGIVKAANNPTNDGIATCILRPSNVFGKGDKMVSDRALRTADNFILGTGDAIHDWVPVECVANAHVMAEEALLPEPESLRDHTGKRAAIGGEAFFIGNNETHTYGWFFGQKTCGDSDALSHWQHRQPKNIPLPIVNMLTHINLFCYNFFGGTPFPRELAPSLVQYTQRSFTFRYDKATKYFGYKRILTVEESIKQLLKRYEAEEATVGQR